MNKYSIKFTLLAKNDLEEIFDYISNFLFAEKSALNLINKIEESVMKLSDFPYSGVVVIDETLKAKGYRKLVIDNYIIFYLINEDKKEAIIMRCIYGGRQYDNLL